MNKIGFQNFRRFANFPPLEFGKITFLVGTNNAGKSTFVKAILLVSDFLKTNNLSSFSFSSKVLEDVNIVSYGRAKFANALGDFIGFYYEFENYVVEVAVTGDFDKSTAEVNMLSIRDIQNNILFLIEPFANTITISRQSTSQVPSENKSDNLEFLEREIIKLKDITEKSNLKKTDKEYIKLITELEDIKTKRNYIAHNVEDNSQISNNYSVVALFDEENNFIDGITNAISEVKRLHEIEFLKAQSNKETSDSFPEFLSFLRDVSIIENSALIFNININQASFFYLGANPTKQSALFSIRDKSNSLAQAINDFYQLRILKGEREYEFIKTWMSRFSIGNDFEINIYSGEAYEVKITDNGKNYISLADKGMGSIQLMLLLFRITAIIKKSHSYNSRPFIIIEEPELNLHPALQSLLADFFLEVYDNYDIRFIIETHSEYLIRKTQLLIKEKDLEIAPNENPFCVLYFDSNNGPYKMNYREDGKFIEKFGTGFFDVSANLTFELL